MLFGKLLSANSGQINFESEHAGSLLIAVKDVQELVSQRVVVFKFTDGRVIRLPKVKMTREPVTITTQRRPDDVRARRHRHDQPGTLDAG